MDRNCPDIYGESSTSESLSETEASVAGLQALNSPLVNPIVTPRFVPTCSRKLLQDLGALASSKGLHIQTHLSENKREVEWVKQLEPDCKHYTEVYKKSGLLGSRTILAHCVHLTDEEVEMVQSTGSGISHCPNSNFSLKSGVCNVQRLRRAGVKVSTCDGRFIEAVGYLDRA
jgi:guanine deaminase